MKTLFDKCGGYQKLPSSTFATLIHLGTMRFCKRFVPYQEDPLGKRTGQMVDAARAGRQNIIEGSERAATSKETEVKLTDVARAHLGELLGDFEMFLAHAGERPWSMQSAEHQAVSHLNPAAFEYTDDVMHDDPMHQRTAKIGPHAGQSFWGCSGYPDCKGTRKI
jgi:hypothetical protein